MDNLVAYVALGVSGVSLGVSVAVAVMADRRHREERHGKIARLRSEFLVRMANIDARVRSIAALSEAIRTSIREMPDGDEKYEAIELLPTQLAGIEKLAESNRLARAVLEGTDTRKRNTAKALMNLQRVEHDILVTESGVAESEAMAVDTLRMIRTINEDSASGGGE